MSHSPEPWRIEDRKDSDYDKYVTILDANNVEVIEGGLSGEDCCACAGHPAMLPIDAERIVACVNACRGIPTEELAKYPNGLDAVGLILLREYLPKRKIVIHNPIVEGGEVIAIKDEV
jgi:hypothetical protein